MCCLLKIVLPLKMGACYLVYMITEIYSRFISLYSLSEHKTICSCLPALLSTEDDLCVINNCCSCYKIECVICTQYQFYVFKHYCSSVLGLKFYWVVSFYMLSKTYLLFLMESLVYKIKGKICPIIVVA